MDEKRKMGRPRTITTIEDIEERRAKQVLYSREYYREHKDEILEKQKQKRRAQKAHALKRRGPVESEPHDKKKKKEKPGSG